MASSIEAVRGTKDVLPQDSYKWRFVERTAQQVAADFGFQIGRASCRERV